MAGIQDRVKGFLDSWPKIRENLEVENNLEFSCRTATRYILVYENRAKSDTVSDLTKVYQSLIEHKPKPKQGEVEYGDKGMVEFKGGLQAFGDFPPDSLQALKR